MKRLVIDCETSGLEPMRHQILTIGMVFADVTPKKLDVLDERHLFVKHDKYRISKKAMEINKINLEKHHQVAVFPKVVCKKIHSFIGTNSLFSTPILGHNVHFDIGFLNALFNNTESDYPFCSIKEDTRYLWEDLKRKRIVNPFLNSKLGTLANHFNIDYGDAHDALVDCHITAKVYQKILGLNGNANE